MSTSKKLRDMTDQQLIEEREMARATGDRKRLRLVEEELQRRRKQPFRDRPGPREPIYARR